MKKYQYTAKSDGGKTITGHVDARDKSDAIEMITKRGIVPTQLDALAIEGPWWSRDIKFGTKVEKKELFTLFSTIATLLGAGTPFVDVLRFAEDNTKDRALKNEIGSLRGEIEGGASLSTSVDITLKSVPKRLRQAFVMGEVSNTLPQAADQVAKSLATEIRIETELRSALVYPAILITMSVAVMGLIIFQLVPVLSPVFETASAEPPVIFRIMESIRSGLLQNFEFIGLGLFAATLLWIWFRSNILSGVQRLLRALPYLRTYDTKRNSLRFCQAMRTMLASGAPILVSLRNSADLLSDNSKKSDVAVAASMIEAGASLSESLADVAFLDPMAKSLIRSGDQSDKLIEMLELTCTSLESDTSATLKRLMMVLTPLLTLAIGALVAVMILSTITAILDLNNVVL